MSGVEVLFIGFLCAIDPPQRRVCHGHVERVATLKACEAQAVTLRASLALSAPTRKLVWWECHVKR
jgi:hypothetical protein